MAGYPLVPPKPQFFAADGQPLSAGTVEVYLAGTSELAEVFADPALTVAVPNPVELDLRGEPDTPVFVAWGVALKLVVKDAAGATVYTADPWMIGTPPPPP
jgi:hypothetical protein